ncbi:MAG: hypothetical protein PHR68_03140 [Candidatus Gracilibacteria bacterium]|nr:hypothetical protein [Candidatus Gracilibacteria bacterium]
MSEIFSGNENLDSNNEKQKNNPLTQEQLEDFLNSQKLYKERLKLIEKRNFSEEKKYDNAKALLDENPEKTKFYNYKGDFYSEISDIDEIKEIQEKGFVVYVPKISRKELEKIVVNFEKEEKTTENIKNLLKNNPNQEIFYELDGFYYSSNPTRIPGNDIGSILRVKEVSRTEIETKLEDSEKGSIERISLRLDKLIANTDNGNLRNYLMELRTNISLNGNNDLILTFGERLGKLLNLFEKSEIKPLNINEIGEIILLSFNILRSGISDLTKIIISYIKDVSSSKLYKFGDDESDYEKSIRSFFENGDIIGLNSFLNEIIGENNVTDIREFSIDKASIPFALSAGGIDGFLDYIQSSVDIIVTPDIMIQNVYQIGKELITNGGEFLTELLKLFKKSSDVIYVIGYIVSVILGFKLYPSKLGALALPNTIIKGLQASGKIPANMIGNIDNFLGKNLQNIEMFVNDKVKTLNIGEQSIIKGGIKTRDSLDSSNTLITSIKTNAKLLKASREALAITNNSLKLAQIFGDSIVGKTNEALTTKNAMNAYKETILKGDDNRFNTDDIDVLIEKTKGETRYNLVLVREKLQEVEKIMEKEILPVFNSINDLSMSQSEYLKMKENIKKNQEKYNKLAILIFNNYLPGFLIK